MLLRKIILIWTLVNTRMTFYNVSRIPYALIRIRSIFLFHSFLGCRSGRFCSRDNRNDSSRDQPRPAGIRRRHRPCPGRQRRNGRWRPPDRRTRQHLWIRQHSHWAAGPRGLSWQFAVSCTKLFKWNCLPYLFLERISLGWKIMKKYWIFEVRE